MTALPSPVRRLARITFLSFLFTFVVARTLVILIMTRTIPDFFLHFGGTHVHHLNYGIFLLAAVAGLALFTSLSDAQRGFCSALYGVGMALTFDEFGMWLHLGGSYWQRASFDAVVVVLSLLGLLAFAPRWKQMRAHHFFVAGVVVLAVAAFSWLLHTSLVHAHERLTPWLLEIERSGPG